MERCLCGERGGIERKEVKEWWLLREKHKNHSNSKKSEVEDCAYTRDTKHGKP